MSTLLTKPLCNKEDLGKPIPNDDHAISMCLPTWRSIVGYEERDKEMMGSIQLGYPRFLYHPLIEKAIEELLVDFPELKALTHQLYPTQKTAKRAYDFILKYHPNAECIITETNQQAFILSYPKECEEIAKCYWQHTGEGISSRHAEYILNNKIVPLSDKAYENITSKISTSLDVDADNIYLFPNGMAAIYMAMRLLQKIHPERSFSQFCFPYGDTLKLLEKFNDSKTLFYPKGNEEDLNDLLKHVSSHPIAGLFTEFPSNPLLSSVDLTTLRRIANEYHFPIVTDNTLGALINTSAHEISDISTISLTKYFSGAGNVMGGALLLNSNQPYFYILKPLLDSIYEKEGCCSADLMALDENSNQIDSRIKKINKNTLEIVSYLNNHPKIENVWHPSITDRPLYDQFLKEEGGYGGLLSFTLKNPEVNTIPFYDKLQICKGPNLGTSFSLCCPFVMLAHYNELDWTRQLGISKWLIRLSVGLEQPQDIIQRIHKALS